MPTKAKFQIGATVYCPTCTTRVTVLGFRQHGPRQKAILSCHCHHWGTLLSDLSAHPPKNHNQAK